MTEDHTVLCYVKDAERHIKEETILEAKLRELRSRLLEIDDLKMASAVLVWDQRVYMPRGGAVARGRQVGTLQRLAHERFVDPAVGRLLDDLGPYEESLPYDSDDASLIRVTRRDYQRLTRIPAAFKAEFDSHMAMSYHTWTQARPANDFARMIPILEKTLDYSRRYSDFFPNKQHTIDPLIAVSDEGVTGADLRKLFGELRENLVPMVKAIAAQPAPDDSCLHQLFPQDKQLAFGLEVVRGFGYDMERGREDLSAHPVTTSFSLDDVRITTRVKEHNLKEALFGTMHESGHGIYTQNIRKELAGTPLGRGATSGVHESQSRLWENLVGRSRPMWEFTYPRLQAAFPDQLRTVPLETFYRAINKVQPSLIRTAADEVTYSLHCAMRFQIELDLLDGHVAVRDLPEVWRERFLHDLGIAPADDRDGVLQDMNWYSDRIGGLYQHYTLGNIMSAIWFETAVTTHPEIEAEMAQGEFGTLRRWLTDHIYTHGRKFTIPELVQRAAGGVLTTESYLRYLRTKYSALYNLD
jgi:carboxypeptidase Taq